LRQQALPAGNVLQAALVSTSGREVAESQPIEEFGGIKVAFMKKCAQAFLDFNTCIVQLTQQTTE